MSAVKQGRYQLRKCARQLHPAPTVSTEGVPWTRAGMKNPWSKFAVLSSSQPQVRIMPVGDRRLNQHTRARLTVNGTPGKLHELRALSCGRSLVCKCFEHHSTAAPPQASTVSGTAQQFFPGKVPTTHPVKHCKTRRRPHLSKVRGFSKS